MFSSVVIALISDHQVQLSWPSLFGLPRCETWVCCVCIVWLR